jgi:molybdate transport system substrate-binding protein
VTKRIVAALAVLLVLSVEARADAVRVMAAFTFKGALDEVVRAYKADGGGDVMPQYGMTPMLAKQVENLAPADIFFSADSSWMDYLQNHDLIRAGSRVDLLTADLAATTRPRLPMSRSVAIIRCKKSSATDVLRCAIRRIIRPVG